MSQSDKSHWVMGLLVGAALRGAIVTVGYIAAQRYIYAGIDAPSMETLPRSLAKPVTPGPKQ